MSPDGATERRLAAYAVELTLEDVPSPVRERTRRMILDTVGVCIRGSDTTYIGDIVRTWDRFGTDTHSSSGGSTVFATQQRRSPVCAAFANAGGGTTLELDEGNQRAAHGGVHVVPPALAIAEETGASGEQLLTAVIAGYETSSRVASAVRPLRGNLHPHGSWAPIGAAVTTGVLMEFDEQTMCDAIRMAVNPTTNTDWTAATEGATVRNLYAGMCCQHGITSALLALSGVTGVERTIERCLVPQVAASPRAMAALEATLETLGERYFLEDSYVKMHAACRYTHAPLDALAQLLDEHQLDADDIVQIRVRTFEAGTTLGDDAPKNVLAAKFSTPYALAARTVLGTSDVEAFSSEHLTDDRIRSLAGRVHLELDETHDERARDGDWGATVEVERRDGTTVSTTVEDARGGGDNPYTDSEVEAKFDRLVDGADMQMETEPLREQLLSLDSVDNVTALFETLHG